VTGFLLDTHALLWFIQGDPQLSNRARDIITTDTNPKKRRQLLYLSRRQRGSIGL
jgi:PIN domain nuclease of toxin-antitoxin system